VSRLNPWQFLTGLARIVAARPRPPAALAGNETLRTVLERRSVRDFKPDPLPDDVWAAILEAGRLAPSTVNLQTWSFGLFTGEQWRDCFEAPPPFAAPRLAIIMADTHRARRVVEGFPRVPLCDLVVGVMNASLAAMNMVVAAEALGVGSVMLSETGRTGFYDAAYLVEKLDLPAGVVPIMTVAFGYPAARRPVMPPKLPLDAVSFCGPYRETDRTVLEDWYRQQQAGYQASNWGERFSAQIAYYNRRLAEADEDLVRLVHREETAD
jgi:nitroreductase